MNNNQSKTLPPDSIDRGYPYPLGISRYKEGFNFALFSKHAYSVQLCLLTPHRELLYEIPLDPHLNKTGDIWHIALQHLPENLCYAYRLDGPKDKTHQFAYDKSHLLLDPYSKLTSTCSAWGSNSKLDLKEGKRYHPMGLVSLSEPFDWQEDRHPRLPLQDMIIYEMHVRGFTQSASSQVTHKGTFLGIVEKIPYLLELGVNAIELMPLQEFDENENLRINPITKQRLCNYWGYSTVNFFAPMNRYATGAGAAINEFKTMVRELHKNGIEIILDVVFNHTGEGNENGPILSFKGIDNPIYYILNPDFSYSNYTGCGNTFNSNHPVAWEFILACLRYWVLEMHVDGFRFDLASILTRGRQGQPLHLAPICEAISEDPLMSNTKLIAEPWDAAGLYQVGRFIPHSKRWSEWNGKYRDAIRTFIKGTPGNKGEFITRLCGSEDLYYNRSPLASINFVTVHDGFTLRDLVSYNQKHNIENGEDNKDGYSHNDSWNCGVEGPTDNEEVISLRSRQMRNFHLTLMISQGLPLLLMGDEYGHTKFGNNNSWCHDGAINWFLWDKIEENADFHRFYKMMIKFRKEHHLVKRNVFLSPKDAQWHGIEPYKPDWSTHTQFIAFTLIDHEQGNDLYIAFNMQEDGVSVHFPDSKPGKVWHLIADTGAQPPGDIFESANAPAIKEPARLMKGYSALLLEAKPRAA